MQRIAKSELLRQVGGDVLINMKAAQSNQLVDTFIKLGAGYILQVALDQ